MTTINTIKIFSCRKDVKIPLRNNEDDAGIDAFINGFGKIDKINKKLIPKNELFVILKPLERIACMLGFKSEIPNGYYASIVPRSGNALWLGLNVHIGTIDSGFRGEWTAIVTNLSNEDIKLNLYDKICQFILLKYEYMKIEIVDDEKKLETSNRGEKGFGSSDKK
jgi:dUTP pyrophosphatase